MRTLKGCGWPGAPEPRWQLNLNFTPTGIELLDANGYPMRMLRPEDILALRDADPFVPFRLHLSDGRTIPIENRDFMWVFKNRINVAIPSGEGRPLDREERIALVHIVSVEEAA